jgi:hypothetical protein
MCIYDVLNYVKCGHVRVEHIVCDTKATAPFPHFIRCEYTERNWKVALKVCRARNCVMKLERERIAAKAEATKERHSKKHVTQLLPPGILLGPRRKGLWKYIAPKASKNPKHSTEHNFNFNILYPIPENNDLEQEEEAIGIESDEECWNLNVHNATSMTLTKGNATEILIKAPPPEIRQRKRHNHSNRLRDSLSETYATSLETKAICINRTSISPPPISLHATTIKAQANAGVFDTTPRRTSHANSAALFQAHELGMTTHVVLSHATPAPLKAGYQPPQSTSIPVLAESMPALKSRDIPISLRPGFQNHVEKSDLLVSHSFAARMAARETLEAAVLAQQFGSQILNPTRHHNNIGIPLAPLMKVRLSAVGLNNMHKGDAPSLPLPQEVKVDVCVAGKLRRVSRRTLKFDDPSWV